MTVAMLCVDVVRRACAHGAYAC